MFLKKIRKKVRMYVGSGMYVRSFVDFIKYVKNVKQCDTPNCDDSCIQLEIKK